MNGFTTLFPKIWDWLGKSLANFAKVVLQNITKLFLVILQSAIILVLAIGSIIPLVWWLTTPIPTQIQADLIVDRVTFRVGVPTELKAIKFHSATFRDFEHIRFTPTVIPNYSAKALGTVQITGKEAQFLPTVVIGMDSEDRKHFGFLQKLLIAENAKVTLAVAKGQAMHEEFAIEIENDSETQAASAAPLAILRQRGAFQVKTRHCQIEGIQLPANFEVTSLSQRKPVIKITGLPKTLRMRLSVPTQDFDKIFPSGVSVASLDFLKQDMIAGQRIVKTAIKQGKITYPAYPNINPVTFGESRFMFFGEADIFKVNKVTYDPDNKGIKIRLSGFVKESVTTSPQAFPENRRDYRLTRSDTIAEASKFN